MKKYILTENTRRMGDITLHQIQAVRSFSDVTKGELSGWVEKESNLSHEGDAWIYGNACACEDAHVYGNARILGNACIFNGAKVYGNAQVYGRACVYGNARVLDNARISGDAHVYKDAYIGENIHISQGLHSGPMDQEDSGEYCNAANNKKIQGENRMRKYVMTGTCKHVGGIILYQIRAARSFGSIKEGDLGGWIEKEENLSHEGDAWVYNIAEVYGNARVLGNARIVNNAQVFGNAQVRDDAFVSGDVLICGDARIYGNAIIYGAVQIYGNAKVSGNAKIRGDACIFGNARVTGSALIYGNTQIYDDVIVSGKPVIRGNAHICGNARIWGNAIVCGNALVSDDAGVCGSAFVCNTEINTYVTEGIHTGGTTTRETPEDDLNLEDNEYHKEYKVIPDSIDSKLKNKLEPTGPTEGQQIKTIQCTKGSGNITIHITIS